MRLERPTVGWRTTDKLKTLVFGIAEHTNKRGRLLDTHDTTIY